MSGKHGHRRSLANGAMRSHFVVVLAPKFDLLPGIVKVHEPMLVQAFKAYPGIEAFDEGVSLCRQAARDGRRQLQKYRRTLRCAPRSLLQASYASASPSILRHLVFLACRELNC